MHPLARYLVFAAFAFSFTSFAWGQAWPVKPMRFVVNFPPGSAPDVVSRIGSQPLGEALGQSIVVENRVGAAGNIGVEAVAKSVPDGYTLLISPGGPIVINPHLYKLSVDVAKDLNPIAPMVHNVIFLVVRSKLPVHNVADLIAYVRANPGKVNFGSPGAGSTLHISAEMMLRAARIQATHIPYKGVAQVLTDLIGGQIDFAFDAGAAVPLIKAGKLRLLAVTSSKRSPIFGESPTMAEAGLDVNTSTMTGVYAPSGTPQGIITRLNREIGRIMQTPEARAALAAIATAAAPASP